MIEIKVNNGQVMEVVQVKNDSLINVTIKEKHSINRVDEISEGDFVMLINYYKYIKNNNIRCDFVNPYGIN